MYSQMIAPVQDVSFYHKKACPQLFCKDDSRDFHEVLINTDFINSYPHKPTLLCKGSCDFINKREVEGTSAI